MKLIITLGMQSEDSYEEHHRGTVEVDDDALISDVLEQAKIHVIPLSPALNRESIKPYLYLMHPETLEKLDENRSVQECDLQDESILRLMSFVR